jgi:hypothetical protein
MSDDHEFWGVETAGDEPTDWVKTTALLFAMLLGASFWSGLLWVVVRSYRYSAVATATY